MAPPKHVVRVAADADLMKRLERQFFRDMGKPKDPVTVALIKTASTLRAAMSVMEAQLGDPDGPGMDVAEYAKLTRLFTQTAKALRLGAKEDTTPTPLEYAEKYRGKATYDLVDTTPKGGGDDE